MGGMEIIMEMLDVYTREGQRTGKLVERGRRYRLADDEYTMVVHALFITAITDF